MTNSPNILVYGFGNPGRMDDGLGVYLAGKIAEWAERNGMANVHTDSNYQLNIEDADVIKDYDIVVFADASVEELGHGFSVTKLDGVKELSFTTHEASPGYVVCLCSSLFGYIPESYLLHIKGYEWNLKEGLSAKGQNNLEKAFSLMKKYLKHPEQLTKT